MITQHQYIDRYPIASNSRRLILGTIHPHNHQKFIIPFFYGNKTSLWNILGKAFPDELALPVSLEGVLNFLKNRKMAISDTIRECRRIHPTALDKDLIPTKLNKDLVDQIKCSEIDQIYFTSGFGKNNAFRLFYTEILGLSITPEIKQKREILLDARVLGRPVRLNVLYSPSASSNVPLSKNEVYLSQKQLYTNSVRPIYDFKVDYYKAIFQSVI